MKLKELRCKLIKCFFIFMFMFFICNVTVNKLYKTNKISNEEYVKLLLSEIYKNKSNDFYTNVVRIFSNNFKPENMILIPKLENKIITKTEYVKDPNEISIANPIVYIYSTNQLKTYIKTDTYSYNLIPNTVMSSYLLKDYLNNLGISSITLNININDNKEVLKENILKSINTYPSLKYFIDFDRADDNLDLSIKIDDVNYTRISFIIDKNSTNYKKNYELITRLSSKLNENYPGISKGVKKVEYNTCENIKENILIIEFENNLSKMNEVINTIKAFSLVFNDFVRENDG